MVSNSEEKTILLGISYVWMTLPITIGCALFVVHAGNALLRRPWRAIASASGAVWAAILLLVAATSFLSTHTQALYAVLAVMFVALIAMGVPVGFVLAAVGVVCVKATGSGDL